MIGTGTTRQSCILAYRSSFLVLVFLIPFLLVDGFCLAGVPQKFEASGVIVTRYRRPTTDATYTNNFKIEYNDCTYFINIWGRWPTSPSLVSQDCTFDGDSSYRFDRVDPDYETSTLYRMAKGKLVTENLPKPVKLHSKASATVWTGPVPLPDNDPILSSLWLAFASHCYYAKAEGPNQRPLFFLSPQFEQARAKLRATWAFSSDGFLRERRDVLTKENIPLVKMGWKDTPNFESSVSEFQVISWTNVQSYTLPSHFILQKFIYDNGVLATNIAGEGIANEIQILNQSRKFVANPPTNIYVRDEREGVAIGNSAYFYASESGSLASMGNVKGDINYKRFVKASNQFGKPPSRVSSWFYVLFAIIIIVPLLIHFGKALWIRNKHK